MTDLFRYRYFSLLCLICLVGCGRGDLAPVSGIVTVNGQPRENVRVVFAPKATAETSIAGPPSMGVTDANGRYELTTKEGDAGAVVGDHNVSFNYDDLEHLGDLNAWLGSAESAAEEAEAKAKIAHVKSEIKLRGEISKSSRQVVTVAAGGHDDADFEVGGK